MMKEIILLDLVRESSTLWDVSLETLTMARVPWLAKEEKVEEVDERAQSREGLWIYSFISYQFVHVNQVFICPYLHLFERIQ